MLSSGLPGTDNDLHGGLTQSKGGDASAVAGEALLVSVGVTMGAPRWRGLLADYRELLGI